MTFSDAVIIALISSLPPTLLALATLINSIRGNTWIKDLGFKVDGHLKQMLENASATSRVEGKVDGFIQGQKAASLPPTKTQVIQDRRESS